MLNFYDINESYTKYLQQFDSRIPNINYESGNNKFVCGVVFAINDIQYYAPISHMTVKQATNLIIYDKGKPISSIRFSFMFPAKVEVLTRKDISLIAKTNPSYANLLATELSFCSAHEAEILKKAEIVYKIGCNENHRYNKYCVDFKRIEKIYNDFNPY